MFVQKSATDFLLNPKIKHSWNFCFNSPFPLSSSSRQKYRRFVLWVIVMSRNCNPILRQQYQEIWDLFQGCLNWTGWIFFWEQIGGILTACSKHFRPGKLSNFLHDSYLIVKLTRSLSTWLTVISCACLYRWNKRCFLFWLQFDLTCFLCNDSRSVFKPQRTES